MVGDFEVVDAFVLCIRCIGSFMVIQAVKLSSSMNYFCRGFAGVFIKSCER